MDQISGGRTGKTEAKSPKHDKYDYNCPKHDFFLLIVLDRFQPETMAGKVLDRSKAIRGRRRSVPNRSFRGRSRTSFPAPRCAPPLRRIDHSKTSHRPWSDTYKSRGCIHLYLA